VAPVFQTGPALEFRHKVMQWLWTGRIGAVVTGAARIGKTTAVEILSDTLYDRYQRPVPVFIMAVEQLDKPTIKSINWQLCSDAGIRTTKNQTSYQLSTAFVHWLLDETDRCDVAQIVLFIDECQRLTPDQFDAFADLYNKLRVKKRYSLTVFMGNDDETSRLTETMKTKAFAHIRGRFFNERWRYRGLRSIGEVRDCLSQYDQLISPKGSGASLIKELLPEASVSEFRLAHAAPLFWGVFQNYKQRCRLTEWGMESFAIATNTLLADLLPRYGLENLTEEMVEEAVRISGLVPSLVSDDV
jgi:hypothetical protein